MSIRDVLFIINSMILIGFITYHCFTKQRKAVVYNVIVLLLLVLMQLVQINYIAIRSGLYDLLGAEKFSALRDVLSDVLFFGASVTVSVEIIGGIISVLLFVFMAANAAVLFAKKCPGKVFATSVSPENEPVEQKCEQINPQLYLVLEKLLN